MAIVILLAGPAAAIDLVQVRTNAIAWLESRQNPDGSWGSGETKQLVTAEGLNALASANRQNALPAQRAITWLRNQQFQSTDYRARALRAMARAGENMLGEANAADRKKKPGFLLQVR